jgi:hypothetical protein
VVEEILNVLFSPSPSPFLGIPVTDVAGLTPSPPVSREQS